MPGAVSNDLPSALCGSQPVRSRLVDALGSYLAPDRRRSLAGCKPLPERASGAVLFADISGFTSLTEALAKSLGPRRGAEELSIHLNLVYESLVACVDQFGGSVVAFAGDAITCWFESDDGGRATAAALLMQTEMTRFAEVSLADGSVCSLAVKVGVAAGQVRRFLPGRPTIHLLDVIAGGTLKEMAEAANTASRHEVLVAPGVVEALDGVLAVREWKIGKESGTRYAVVEELRVKLSPEWNPGAPGMDEEALRPHLLRPVFERLRAGQGEFLTELRPAIALFLKFDGIDYDADEEAGAKLDHYLVWVQDIVDRLGGFLLAVGMGDKGSHLYCCFGAPIAHEDAAWRAAKAADELRRPPPDLAFITRTQIGISSGTLRTGSYGSSGRRTYGVLGDAVNLAARLMEHACPGQVLLTEEVRQAARAGFEWQACTPIKPKGKSQLVPVVALVSQTRASPTGLSEPAYSLPLIGRAGPVRLINEVLQKTSSGHGSVLKISAEAGMGKSRLVTEAIRMAREQGLTVLAGQCLSHGTSASYLPWQGVFQMLFGLSGEAGANAPVSLLERRLTEIDSTLLPRLPLFATVLKFPIPENDVTAPMEARLRKASLEDMLVRCIRRAARVGPLLIVLEDCHWIDPLSADLLDLLARRVEGSPVTLLFTRRPPERDQDIMAGLEQISGVQSITLQAFERGEAEMLIQLKLAQLFGFTAPPPAELLERLVLRSAGNPFYLEELLNFLRDQKVSFEDPRALAELDLPASLHTLILSRIDRLTETEQSTLKLASVVGRLFPEAVLSGLRPEARPEDIATDLAGLCRADLTALDRPPPEAAYIFKHVVTQEVTYQSLPHSTRARLHGQIGLGLELLYADRIEQHLDLLAFHFDRSTNPAKRKEYLLRAGEGAQSRYANAAAIGYYERALPLLRGEELIGVYLKLGKVRELVGEWKKAGACYQKAFETAEQMGDRHAQARCQGATGDLLRKQGLFSEAEDWLGIARTLFEELGDDAGVGQTLHAAGTVAAMQGDYRKAATLYNQSLNVRKSLGDRKHTADLLNNLGIIDRFQADYERARVLMDESLAIRRELGDRWAVANSLNNYGVLLRDMGQPASARAPLEESLALNRQVGDRWAVANVLSSLGEASADLGDWVSAANFLLESLTMNLDLGDKTGVAFILEAFVGVATGLGKPEEALKMAGAASELRATIGSPLSPGEQRRLDHNLSLARSALPAEAQLELFELGRKLHFDQAVAAARQICEGAGVTYNTSFFTASPQPVHGADVIGPGG